MRIWLMGWGLAVIHAGSWPVFGEDKVLSQNKAGLEKMIVGGKKATQGAYPWMAALIHSHDLIPYRGFFSGASLIHPEWLLTAAHVVEGKRAEDIHALIGHEDLLSATEEERLEISEIVRHASFGKNGRRLGADLALLRLASPVENVPTLGIVSSLRSMRPGMMTRTMGWGTTSTRGFRSSSLRSVDVPVIPTAAVDANSVYGEDIPSDVLLAGDPGGLRDTCDGDSGGPLLHWDGGAEDWRMIAVVAGGADVGCAVKGTYGLYTMVAPHRAWIESVVVRRYADWAGIYQVGDGEADADGDGFTNWDEYAFATQPYDLRSQPRLVSAVHRGEDRSFPALSARGRSGVEDLGYRVEISVNLTQWKSLATLSATKLPSNSMGEAVIRWRSPISLNESGTQFFRVLGIRRGARSALEMNDASSTVGVASH